jgi:hypothetical protein
VNDRGVSLSTRMISTGDEIRIRSRSSSGATSLQVVSPDSKRKDADHTTRDSVCTSPLTAPLFLLESPPITTSRYSYISSSLLRLHAQAPDHRWSIACAVQRHGLNDDEDEDLGIHGTENVEERDGGRSCPTVYLERQRFL